MKHKNLPSLPHSKCSMAKSLKEKRWVVYGNLGPKSESLNEIYQSSKTTFEHLF